MRSELDVLLDKIDDPTLRADIYSQVERLRAQRTFGLVFESHLPERVRLLEHPVRVGAKVVHRDKPESPAFEVQAIKGKTATLRKARNSDGSFLSAEEAAKVTDEKAQLDSLVVIADFGEPVFPGLRHLGSIARGADKPAHVVIKGENHHVLEALQFTHAGKIDCIYIDPPYNSGARDWKYDNNYVDQNDAYRHSKWLAFMERRLVLAKQLLNPENSVLIVTIDEKEYLRLGMLLRQTFVGSKVQMISTVISPSGAARNIEFTRVNEYVFFVMLGAATPCKTTDDMLFTEHRSVSANRSPIWNSLRRLGAGPKRADSPSKFYAVLVEPSTGRVVGAGEALPLGVARETYVPPRGTAAVWPLLTNGDEARWELARSSFLQRLEKGYVRQSGCTQNGTPNIQYLRNAQIERLANGELETAGFSADGSLLLDYAPDRPRSLYAKTIWNKSSHDSRTYGTWVLRDLIPGRQFPFPKSLYAVEDTLRFFVKDKPDAVVLDFFAGSGTTTHAVARLNRQDGGRRQSIVVTNNEVSSDEAETLRKKGSRPGHPNWEALGIFEYITRPRITAAITGRTLDGESINGDYKFTDEFPMAEGFDENVEFFELTYLDPDDVEIDIAFSSIAPLLWKRAGGRGPIICECLDAADRRKPYAWTENYGVLFNPDRWRTFVERLPHSASAAFIVTDSQTTFAGIASELPGALDVVRLYENYLTTFAINRGHI
ncbi:MAG TPA: DNA methyltransferase [Pirellulales bacterium]|nr:DNA methyltransferase [Pirellulales bacterium]